jgi:hypothetical protein
LNKIPIYPHPTLSLGREPVPLLLGEKGLGDEGKLLKHRP